ncbi:MAG: TonB-dependent receptor [Puniceicoccaceae bacterium]|nr:TonB-dependent receptor [Puniceicoccaceae bacterium]
MIKCRIYPLTILALASLPLLTQAESTQTLPTLYVDVQQTANVRPVTTYESPVSNLEFEPRVDLQSRNMAEAQGDITIRGGLFENSGFRVGSATLIDPQTGHYSAELPIAPEMLTRPDILIGADNALYGFNSTVGTISYGWRQIADGGSLTSGGGDHNLNFQRIHNGLTGQLGESGEWSWGVEAEISRSESDGTIQFGDHNFDRTSGRLQLVGPNSQTDFFAGYQAKFFGWPNMYTPYGVNETENLKTSLLLFNHAQNYNERSYFEITAYYREHKDHYIYSRENPSAFQAKHTTDVSTLAFSGLHALGEAFSLSYSGQITADEIESTSLESGRFESRTYSKLSLLPECKIELAPNEHLVMQIGGSFDDTDRNDSEFSLISNIAWGRQHYNGNSESVYLSYSETSQVAGYTAIGGSETTGLFRSNHDLGREKTQNVEIGTKVMRQDWSIEAAVFYRWDDNLVDWTFAGTSAREANPVDIETFGLELITSKRWDSIEAIASYTFLDKDEDYGNDTIDASFYALNYAKHRFTLGAIWTLSEIFQFRIDNEWRKNEDNSLRESSDSALFTHFGLSIYLPQLKNMELFLAVDNAWDDDFQDVPGTPGRGDQYSAGVTYNW